MYARETQLATQVRAAQDKQKIDQFLKVFFIAKAEQVTRHLSLIFCLRVTNDAMPFEHLLKTYVVVSSSFTFISRLISGIKIVPKAGAIGDQKTQGTYAISNVCIPCYAQTNREKACLLTFSIF